MDLEILNDLLMGYCRVFYAIFPNYGRTAHSYVIGTALVHWLLKLGIDVETYVANEMAHYEADRRHHSKRLVFERCGE
jgi:hypothetical protein